MRGEEATEAAAAAADRTDSLEVAAAAGAAAAAACAVVVVGLCDDRLKVCLKKVMRPGASNEGLRRGDFLPSEWCPEDLRRGLLSFTLPKGGSEKRRELERD